MKNIIIFIKTKMPLLNKIHQGLYYTAYYKGVQKKLKTILQKPINKTMLCVGSRVFQGTLCEMRKLQTILGRIQVRAEVQVHPWQLFQHPPPPAAINGSYNSKTAGAQCYRRSLSIRNVPTYNIARKKIYAHTDPFNFPRL